MDHKRIKPKSIMQLDIVDHFSKDYMYLRSIQFIHEVILCFIAIKLI